VSACVVSAPRGELRAVTGEDRRVRSPSNQAIANGGALVGSPGRPRGGGPVAGRGFAGTVPRASPYRPGW
jgi:hypothetical protein